MSAPLRVLIVTDSFPPVCGGSGWSTWELVRGLTTTGGHHVEVVKIEIGQPGGTFEGTYEGVRLTTFRKNAPQLPVVRNIVQNERLWTELSTQLLSRRLAREPVDVIHAQHVKSTVPAIRAGAAAGVPVVATVRDYWPVCYWSDLIYDPEATSLCPACTVPMMTRCVLPRAGVASVAAWSVIPYMRANLRTKRRTLARAGAIIAVSSVIARDLVARAPEIAQTPLFTIPNPVDMVALDEAALASPRPLAEPYVLYVGKLATNKGVQFLMKAVADANIRWPLVIVGDGPLKGQLETEARARQIDARVRGLAGSTRGARVDAPRRAAGVSVVRPRIAQPRADRSVRRSACRSPRWTRAARATSSIPASPDCSPPIPRGSRAIWRGSRQTTGCARRSAPRRGRMRITGSRRHRSSRASSRSTAGCCGRSPRSA